MTLTAWRIVQAKHLDSAFSGEGASKYPGRWNHGGIPMVYTAESISLAALEMLVHLDNSSVLGQYLTIPASFSKDLCRTIVTSQIPPDWSTCPAPNSTRDLGTQWAKGNGSLVLKVPSVIVPGESVYLINPLHPDYPNLEFGGPQRFHFDPHLKL